MRCKLCDGPTSPVPFPVPVEEGEWSRCQRCGSDSASHGYDIGIYTARDEYGKYIGMDDHEKNKDGFRWIEEWIAAYTPGRDLLDVGCWSGAALDLFASRGWSVHGFDVSRPPYHGPHVTVAPSFNRWLFPQRYSAVLAAEVLEHVPAPDLLLHELHGVTVPNGIVCVTTPFPRIGFTNKVYGRHHLFLASEHRFRHMLSAAMLDVLDFRTHEFSMSALCRARK